MPYPDISTKAKAQKFIGLDMDKLHAEKKAFIERVVPEWHRQAEEREQLYNVGVLNVGVLND